jgi:tRNA(fMet)-specific endonuclease VapC
LVAVKYLLDSNTCVQFLRHGSATPVAARLAGVAPADVVLCSVVVGELLYGALRSRDVTKNLNEVHSFAARFPSLPFDDRSAREYARVRADLAAKGTPIGPNDLLIAAIALANGLTLVTHNTTEFQRVVGLPLDDWQI